MAYSPKYKPNCRVCQLTRGPQPERVRLRERIVRAKFRREPGDETLSQIAAEIGASWPSMSNHCNKHIRDLSETTMARRKAKAVAKVKMEVMKKQELSFDHDEVIPEQEYEKALKSIVAMGIERLERDEITVSTAQLIAAAKILGDQSAKKRGQDAEIIKTMYRFAAGNKQEKENGPDTPRTTDSDNPGSGRPSDIHNETTWDALARRAEALSQGNA